MRLINPFVGFIILRLFFTVYYLRVYYVVRLVIMVILKYARVDEYIDSKYVVLEFHLIKIIECSE